MLTLLCGHSAPTHLSARTVLDYTASRYCRQALWSDEVRLCSPQCVRLQLSFFHGCRQTRLEDWQTLFEDQRQGDMHPSGFSGQSGLSNWVCRISKFLGGNELHLVFESPFPLLCHSQIPVILHAIPQSSPQCWGSCLKPMGSLFPLEEPETRGRPLSRVLCCREGEACSHCVTVLILLIWSVLLLVVQEGTSASPPSSRAPLMLSCS